MKELLAAGKSIDELRTGRDMPPPRQLLITGAYTHVRFSQEIQLSERDFQIISAMRRAIRSMELVDGLVIHFQDMTGHLSFGHDIDRLNEALLLTGADTNEPPAEPPA